MSPVNKKTSQPSGPDGSTSILFVDVRWAVVTAVDPGAAVHFGGYLVLRPCKVNLPTARLVKAVLGVASGSPARLICCVRSLSRSTTRRMPRFCSRADGGVPVRYVAESITSSVIGMSSAHQTSRDRDIASASRGQHPGDGDADVQVERFHVQPLNQARRRDQPARPSSQACVSYNRRLPSNVTPPNGSGTLGVRIDQIRSEYHRCRFNGLRRPGLSPTQGRV